MRKNIRFILALSIFLFAVTLCGFTAAAQDQTDDVQANETVEAKNATKLDKQNLSLVIGTSSKVKVRNFKGKVKWSVSDGRIATVSRKGKVTAKKKGTCELFADLDNGTRLSVEVKVTKKISKGNLVMYGHRGDECCCTENTIRAFKSSMKKGFDGVEMDVRFTDSGDFLIFHDETTGRLCEKDVPVIRLSKNSRKKYPLVKGAGSKGRKEYIPTLEESLTALKPYNTTVIIHLKGFRRFGYRNGTDKLVKIIKKTGMQDNVVVFCSSRRILKLMRGEGIKLGISVPDVPGADSQEVLDYTDPDYISYFFCLYRYEINEKIVERAHEMGLKIGLYKTRSKAEVQYLKDIGADFAILQRDLNREKIIK